MESSVLEEMSNWPPPSLGERIDKIVRNLKLDETRLNDLTDHDIMRGMMSMVEPPKWSWLKLLDQKTSTKKKKKS
jgi:hypothetical protein